MVLETGVLPPPLQLYAAAAAHLSSRPPWAPLLHYPGAASLFGMPGTFGPLVRPRYPPPGMRAPTGPPSEDSGSETHSPNKGTANILFPTKIRSFWEFSRWTLWLSVFIYFASVHIFFRRIFYYKTLNIGPEFRLYLGFY